jgi:hypothetical protein
MMSELRFETDDPHDLARKLIAEGKAERGDTLMTMRGEMRCLTGSVGWFADHTVREDSVTSPTFVKWRPFPDTRRRALAAKSASPVSQEPK